jgi:hypothetical protein
MADPTATTILLQATLLATLSPAFARVARRASRTWVFATVGGVLLVQLVAVVTLFVGFSSLAFSAEALRSMNVALAGVWTAGAAILGYEHERLSRPRLIEVYERTSLPLA